MTRIMHISYMSPMPQLLSGWWEEAAPQTHRPLIRWLAETLLNADVTCKAAIQGDFRYLPLKSPARRTAVQGPLRPTHGLPPKQESWRPYLCPCRLS